MFIQCSELNHFKGGLFSNRVSVLQRKPHSPCLMSSSQRQVMPTPDDDSGSDREDELPQVVVLKSGDLTAEDVKKIKGEMRSGGGAGQGKTE